MKKILNIILISMFAVNLFAAEASKSELKSLADGLENSATRSLTPLISAVIVGKIEDVKECLNDIHCDVNAQDNRGMTALHWAISSKEDEIAKLLISDVRVSVKILDHDGISPLGLAVTLNNLELAKKLYELQEDPYFGIKLKLRISAETLDMIDFINNERKKYQSMADSKSKVYLNSTIAFLNRTSKSDSSEDRLIKHMPSKFDVNLFNEDGVTLIETAFKRKYFRLFKKLLDRKATMTFSVAKSPEKEIYHEYLRIMQPELNKVEQKKLMDESAKMITLSLTPLMEAVLEHNLEDVKKCLDNENCDINAQDKTGSTALHWAVSLYDNEIARTMLNNSKINVKILDNDGISPFGLAIILNNLNLAKDIYKVQKDPYFGVKPKLCKNEEDKAMIDFLNDKRKEYHSLGDDLSKNYIESTINLLIKVKIKLSDTYLLETELAQNLPTNVDINLFNEDGVTLIETAFRGKHFKLFKALLDHKVIMNFSVVKGPEKQIYEEYLEFLRNNMVYKQLNDVYVEYNRDPKNYAANHAETEFDRDLKRAMQESLGAERKNIAVEYIDPELEKALKESKEMYDATINEDSVDNNINSFKKEKGKELIAACDFGDLDEISNLIKLGADLTVTDDAGNSALHLAVINNNTELVKLLLTKKINKELKNGASLTAFALAKEFDNRDIMKLLKP